MNGMNELITVAKYWRQWSDPRLVVLALNNRDLNMVTWEMGAESGNPKFEASQDLPDFRYSQYAEQLGLKGVFVDRPYQVAAAWEAAFAADRPVVIEAYPPGSPIRHLPFASLREGNRRRGRRQPRLLIAAPPASGRVRARFRDKRDCAHEVFGAHFYQTAIDENGL